MVWGAISYHGRSNLLRIESNLNNNRYVHEVLQPEVVPFLQRIPGDIFQQDSSPPNVAKTVRDFCSAQHMQLFPGCILIRWIYRLVSTCEIMLVGVSLVFRVLQLQKTNFACAYK